MIFRSDLARDYMRAVLGRSLMQAQIGAIAAICACAPSRPIVNGVVRERLTIQEDQRYANCIDEQRNPRFADGLPANPLILGVDWGGFIASELDAHDTSNIRVARVSVHADAVWRSALKPVGSIIGESFSDLFLFARHARRTTLEPHHRAIPAVSTTFSLGIGRRRLIFEWDDDRGCSPMRVELSGRVAVHGRGSDSALGFGGDGMVLMRGQLAYTRVLEKWSMAVVASPLSLRMSPDFRCGAEVELAIRRRIGGPIWARASTAGEWIWRTDFSASAHLGAELEL